MSVTLHGEDIMTVTPIFLCKATHPTTGNVCSKSKGHEASDDPLQAQHQATNGVKWPSLQELDPAEGFNGPQPYRN